jgi:hypothetical protein
MNMNNITSWWVGQSLGMKIFWILFALVVLSLILSAPVYWDWANK